MGEVTRLGGIKINPPLHAILQPCHPGAHFLRIIQWSLSTYTRKMVANHVFCRLMLFNTHLLLLLQPSVLWLSIVTFNNEAKPPPKWFLRKFDVSRNRPWLGGLPQLETFTWQNLTPAERVTRSGRPGYPPWRSLHQSCKHECLVKVKKPLQKPCTNNLAQRRIQKESKLHISCFQTFLL